MDYLKELESINSVTGLEDFARNHYHVTYDFLLGQNHVSIQQHKSEIERIFLAKLSLIKQLDLSVLQNQNFVNIFLAASERIGAFSIFDRLYDLLEKASVRVNRRLQVMRLYTKGIKRYEDYVERYEDILTILEEAYQTEEEDSLEIILATFIQFYARVVNNFGQFNQPGVLNLKARITLDTFSKPLLQHPVIEEVLKIDVSDFKKAYTILQEIIDELLKRASFQPDLYGTELLIEQEHESQYNYISSLQGIQKLFKEIRNIATRLWQSYGNETIYRSLGRGISIIKEELQLYGYLNSYGNAHYAKMMSALESVDFSSITNKVDIIDWGCGQGLASVCLLEYYDSLDLSSILLIEPSELSLKRASIHIRHMNDRLFMKTICKTLDQLVKEDIKTNPLHTKIHLFSNILDIDNYSMVNLWDLIEKTQEGVNYFLCVSPYVNDIKTERINGFYQFFEDKYDTFDLLASFTESCHGDYWNCNKKFKDKTYCSGHPVNGCGKKWTRVIRVFKVEL